MQDRKWLRAQAPQTDLAQHLPLLRDGCGTLSWLRNFSEPPFLCLSVGDRNCTYLIEVVCSVSSHHTVTEHQLQARYCTDAGTPW